jgi:hypothetical protein
MVLVLTYTYGHAYHVSECMKSPGVNLRFYMLCVWCGDAFGFVPPHNLTMVS